MPSQPSLADALRASLVAAQRAAAPVNPDTHCMIHNVDEPDPGFRGCLECKHLYKTERELIDTYNEVGRQADEDARAKGWTPLEFRPVDDVEQIWFCPLCTHDF